MDHQAIINLATALRGIGASSFTINDTEFSVKFIPAVATLEDVTINGDPPENISQEEDDPKFYLEQHYDRTHK